MTETAEVRRTRPAAPRPGRMAWLDNLRVWLTVLVLAHHAALTYSDLPIWPYWERPADGSSSLLDLLIMVNQAWFMGAFFLIAGYVAPGAVDRHGVAGFVRGRLLRLGVPYLLFVVVLALPYRYPGWATSAARAAGQGYLGYLVANFDPGPLWFVLVLLVFSLVYAAVRGVTRRAAATAAGRVPGVAVIVGLGLALGVVTWVWEIGTPSGTYWPVAGLPSPNCLPQYVVCFVLGTMAARRDWLRSLRPRTAWACAPIALVTLVGTVAAALAPGGLGGGTPVSLVACLCGGVFAATTIVVALVVSRTLLDRDGRAWRFLSGQAFAVYVLHAPILVWLAVALAGLTAPAVVKAAVLLVAGIVVTWSAAWLLRRVPGARRVF